MDGRRISTFGQRFCKWRKTEHMHRAFRSARSAGSCRVGAALAVFAMSAFAAVAGAQEIGQGTGGLIPGMQALQPTMTLESNTDRPGQNYRVLDLEVADPSLCGQACMGDSRCRAYTYVKPGVQGPKARCWLKTGVPSAQTNPCCVSGVKTDKGGAASVPMYEARPLAVGTMTVEQDTDRPGANIRVFDLDTPDPQRCAEACQENAQCRAYTFVRPRVQGPKARCWLKSEVPSAKPSPCCISGVKQAFSGPPPGAGPSGQGEWAVDAIAQQRRSRLTTFDRTWQQTAANVLGNSNARMVAGQRKAFQAGLDRLRAQFQQQTPAKIRSAAPALANAEVQKAVFRDSRPSRIQLKEPPGPSGTVEKPKVQMPSSMQPVVAPRITSLWPLPNRVLEGGDIIVFGENFGSTPGRVRLEYEGLRPEFALKGPHYVKDLLPHKGDWKQAWFDHAIVVRVPELPEKDIAWAKAKLVVWRDGPQSFVLRIPVTIELDYPAVFNLRTQPEYGDGKHVRTLVPGGALILEGTHFGAKPGKVSLELSIPIAGKKEVSLLPGSGTWQTSWSGNKIHLKVDSTHLPKNFPWQTATLKLWNDKGKGSWEMPLPFGPRMIATHISGAAFLELDKKDDEDQAKEIHGGAESNAVLVVSHDPGCGWIGNDGEDWFFRKKPLPPNVSVLRWTFTRINPDYDMQTLKALLNEVKDWIEKILDEGPVGFMKKFGEYIGIAIGATVDEKAGSYVAEVRKKPAPGDPSVRIHWENTCVMTYKGVPVKYAVSFVLWGPDGIVPGSK